MGPCGEGSWPVSDEISRELLAFLSPQGETDPGAMLRMVTREHLDSLDPIVAEATRRAAIVHYFDPTILAAILDRPENGATSEVTGLYGAIRALPFVEDAGAGRSAVHAATRAAILESLWTEDAEHFREVSSLAAAYFGRDLMEDEEFDLDDAAEFVYHDILEDEDTAMETALGLLDGMAAAGRSGLGHALVAGIAEHAEAGRLSPSGKWGSGLLAAHLALALGQYADAVDRAQDLVRATEDTVPRTARGRAARIVGDGLAMMGSYEQAIDWYQQAAELEVKTAETVSQHHLDIAWARHMQGSLAEAATATEAAIEAMVGSLLIPLPGGAFQQGVEVFEVEILDADESDQSSSSEDAGPLYLPEATFALNPDAWARGDEQQHYIAAQMSEDWEARAASGDEESGNVFWPIRVTAQLGAAWRRLGGIAYDADDFPKAEACARLSAQIAEDVDDAPGNVASVQLIYQVGGTTGDVALSEAALVEIQASVDQAREYSDLGVQIPGLLLLGSAYADKPDYIRAAEAFEAAAAAATEARDPISEARAHHGLAGIAASARDYDLAEERYVKALDLLREANARDDEARFLLDAGDLAFARHRHAEAEERYLSALRTFRELDAHAGEFNALTRVAYLARDRRRDFEAGARYEEAVELARKTGAPSQQVQALTGLGTYQSELGQHALAESHLQEALDLARRIGSRGQEAVLLEALGDAARARRDWPKAIEVLTRARESYRALAKPLGEVGVLHSLADVFSSSGQPERGVEYSEEALALATSTGSREAERNARHELALAYSEMGRHQEAIEAIEQVVREDPDDARGVLDLGWILFQADEFERSIDHSRRALELDPTQNDALRQLGHATLALGRIAEARSWYDQAIERRHEGEDFVGTIETLRKLIKRRPDTPEAQEILTYIEQSDRVLAHDR